MLSVNTAEEGLGNNNSHVMAVAMDVDPSLVWGNQETMWPMSRAALSANASERLMALATPKKDFQQDHPLKCNRYYTKPVKLGINSNNVPCKKLLVYTVSSTP